MHAALLPSLAAVVLAAACTPPSAREPAPTPSPSRPPATTRSPSAPAGATPSTSGGGAARAIGAFSYAPGSYRFVVTNEATIELSSDSGGGRQAQRTEPVSSRLVVEYRVTGRGAAGARALAGTVDSFTVTREGAPPPPTPAMPLLPAPLAFRGTLDPARTRLELHPGTSAAPSRVAAGGDCNSPNEALLVLAREAVVVVPPGVLVPGRTWDDSTESVVCRGDVPLTVRAVHHYRVEGVEPHGDAGAAAVRVSRASEMEVAGQGAQHGLAVTVSGRGSARADLFLDATAGHFLGGTGESTLELDLQAPERAKQHVVQRGKTRVEMQM